MCKSITNTVSSSLCLMIVFICLTVPVSTVCPASAQFYLAADTQCYAVCPWQAPNKYYSYLPTNTCELICPSTYYGFDGNKSCTTTCPSAPVQTFYDTTNKRCVNVCPANYFGYLGAVTASNQFCVQDCPSPTYSDYNSSRCVTTCPVGTFYMDGSRPNCTSRCPSNYYGSPTDRKCKVGGSCPSSPLPYFSDDTTNLCVTTCPANYFADSFTGRCLVYCSLNYFGDSSSGIGICVQVCPDTYYRDNITRKCVRTCPQGSFINTNSGNCTAQCPTDYFGDNVTKKCVDQCPYPTFGDPQSHLCNLRCPYGYYADNFTQICVVATSCYGNTVGDPTTNKCVNITGCPNQPYYYADLVNKLCVVLCPESPVALYGDKTTKMCVSVCPWRPPYYVSYRQEHTRTCVSRCPEIPIHYASNLTKSCVESCPQPPDVPYSTFADAVSQQCVQTCPNGFYSVGTPNYICVSTCPSTPTLLFYYGFNQSCIASCPQDLYADTSKQMCVLTCPTKPSYFGYNVNNTCLAGCPDGYFADQSTRECVEACPVTTLQYGDISTNYCVDRCPMMPDLYGQDLNNGNRTCVLQCELGYFADPLTRTCVKKCNMTQGYFGEPTTRRCVLDCNTTFADNTTGRCVTQCPRSPQYYYGNPVNNRCVLKCPEFLYANRINNLCVEPSSCQTNFFADDFSNFCVAQCPVLQNTFGESVSRRCVSSCPRGTFADNTTRRCSSSCNATARLFRDPSTKRCVTSCPSMPLLYANPLTMVCQDRCTSNYFAYDPTRQCMSMCPATPAYFGDLQTYRCLLQCPRQFYKFVNNTFRGCLATCPPRVYTATYVVDMYADNTTWSCVTLCPQSQNMYNFKHPTNPLIRKCVLTCPIVGSTFYFAENVTQSCVTQCPTAIHFTYGDIFTSKCQSFCTRNQYRDSATKRCTYFCSEGTFADNTTWSCVTFCPQGYYGETINNTCQRTCPTGYYAQFWTRLCRTDCLQKWYWYADNTTAKCVRQCPKVPNMFANFLTRHCNYFCTGNMFADNNTGKCVVASECSDSQIAQPNTKRCVYQCPIQIPSFLDNSSNTCVEVCTDGYADNSTMRCVDVCPSRPDFYAYNHTTLGPICVYYCPPNHYRHSVTRQCLQSCPGPLYFRDTLTMNCVKKCPDHFYANSLNQLCVSNCSVAGRYADEAAGKCVPTCPDALFADPTTYLCVGVCPFGYFGQNNVCTPTCTTGFADPITKVCQLNCSVGYFAKLPEHKCVMFCFPQYGLLPDRICISDCPVSSNLTQNMYYQPNSHVCVFKCLPTWYADNSTRSCQQTCSPTYFADNSTGLCVDKCPRTPDFYGYNLVCYSTCPLATHFAENITRTCKSQCPAGSWADPRTRRCMDICSGVQYGFQNTNTSDRICMYMCPEGFYGYWPNKTCVDVCPDGTYGQNGTNICVTRCPENSYGDNFQHLCVENCSASRNEYADGSTNRCVRVCPVVPSLYAQDNGRICVSICETDWYRLNLTRKCVDRCPASPPLFADPISAYCVYKCQIDHNLYADNQTRTCSPTCPNITNATSGQVLEITYADDSTKRCVSVCPSYPMLYGYNASNRCVPLCLTNTYGDNHTRICHDVCFFGPRAGPNNSSKYTWADDATNFCTQRCTRNTFADNATVRCVGECTLGTFADNSTWRCVAICPVNPLSFAYQVTKKCIYECPAPLFGNEDGRVCSTFCPTAPFYYYRDYQRKRCVKNCTHPRFADTFSQSCATSCQFGFFKNIAEHTCQRCPSSCISCQAALNCTSCQLGLFMHNGQCIESCPTLPIRYYGNDLSSTCVTTCIAPYFGFQGTGKCQIGCPETYYSDADSGTCKLCPVGCQYCLRTNCSSCLTGYIYAAQSAKCSQACNQTHVYFNIDRTCALNCVPGTFLLSDLVSCQACSTQCLTCANIGTNCTSCLKKFWYNYLCVDKCPDRYYVDSDFKCQYCGDNNQNCQLPPLSYNITTYTKNYKLYARVQFNRAVNMTISEFIKYIQIKSQNRAIKPNQFVASKNSSTVYIVMFKNSSSLNQMSLSFGFTPGFIVDGSGNALTTTEISVQTSTVTTTSQETETKTATLQKQVSVLSYILIAVVFAMMIKFSYPLLVFVDSAQFLYMHLFVVINILPYMWFNINSVFGYFHFNFLPKLYEYDTTTTSKQQPYNTFRTDMSFLGNIHPFVFFVSIYCGLYFLVWLFTTEKVNRFEGFRKKVRWLYKARFRYSILFEAFYLTLFYTFFHAVYQFKGYNNQITSAAANKALAVICMLVGFAFLIVIAVVSSRTRQKILQVPKRIEKKKPLPKMPSKYKFLVYEPSQFPLQIAIRTFLKICVCFALQLQNAQVQLILLMVFNLVYLIYTLVFKPSLYKFTNRLNMFISLCFIALEAVLFAYTTTSKSPDQQETTSLICLAIEGLMMVLIVIWMIYRLLILIAERCFGKKYTYQFEVEPVKSKKNYGKIKQDTVRDMTMDLKKNKFQLDGDNQKDINVSELNAEDQENQEQSVNPDALIKQFAYHFVPQKTEEQIKKENKLLGIKSSEKKKLDPIVIQIDEDELISDEKLDKKGYLPALGSRQVRTGHLKIEENNSEESIDRLDLNSRRSRGSREQLRSKNGKSKKDENQVIWSHLDANSQHSSQI